MIDGHHPTRLSAVDDDLHRLPAERDHPAASADCARPRLHQSLLAARFVIVGDEWPRLGRLEELHERSHRRFLGVAVEDDGRHQQQRATRARMTNAALEPRPKPLGDRGGNCVSVGARELGENRTELVEAVRRAFEEVAGAGEEALRSPSPFHHASFRIAVQPQRIGDRAETELDVGLSCRLRTVVPRELTIADVMPFAMTEVDPVTVSVANGAAPPSDRVRGVEDHHSLAVPSKDRPGNQAA